MTATGGRLSKRRALEVWSEFSEIVHRSRILPTNKKLLNYIRRDLERRTIEPFLEGARFSNKFPLILRPGARRTPTPSPIQASLSGSRSPSPRLRPSPGAYREGGVPAAGHRRRTAANFIQQGRRIGHAAEREFHRAGPAAAKALAARRSESVLKRRGGGMPIKLHMRRSQMGGEFPGPETLNHLPEIMPGRPQGRY